MTPLSTGWRNLALETSDAQTGEFIETLAVQTQTALANRGVR